MEQRPFGATGIQVPVVGQGTWKLRNHARAEAALRLGLDLGMTHIDTAELYTGSEETVAQAIAGRRQEVFLVTKVLPRNASHAGTLAACEASTKRLGTAPDVYLLHWWGDHPIEETMRAMGELIDAKRIRWCGVSNLDVAQLELAQDALGARHKIVCNQVPYDPENRSIEAQLIPYCRGRGIAIVGYSTFGSGRFPGGKRGLDRVAAIGAEHGKSAHQVVLDAMSRDPNVFLIPKAETEGHVRQNAAALNARLPQDAYDAFDALFPPP